MFQTYTADRVFLCSSLALQTTLLWEAFPVCLFTKLSLRSSEPFTSTVSSDVKLSYSKTKKRKKKEKEKKKQ